ncbi:acyl-CoA dehydrogenase family protein [Novosphingobium sp. JCM 18896]|uniref:acyl-CoA dehydrogenase family protein n=1 Tax=Novosphingobium sp. JCM 18896 TaxID=2989731 RepID=UPI002221B733|nr:acyl-CoA dehydrogenase family protein [Novosphingobium sp. JCM 18896]MCW1432490.1 acyl-CoA/acyl-ACP dehydrogenase [Novosphingobium sp. JCM 18896]
MIFREELQVVAREVFGDETVSCDAGRVWRLMSDLGWLGIRVPTTLGGLELERGAETVLHYELGRVLGPGSVAAHMSVIQALVACHQRDPLQEALQGALFTSSLTFTTATEANGRINGHLKAVPDAHDAARILVAASDRLLLYPLDASGIEIRERRMWDETRRMFDVSLNDVAVDRGVSIAQGDAARTVWDEFNGNVLHALAADSLGGAQAILAMTIDHLKVRHQFDRPLAMFQALKHRSADLFTALSGAEAMLWQDMKADVNIERVGAFKAYAAGVFHHVVEEAVQLHGGIGLTSEHRCHRFLKRALLNDMLGGTEDEWFEAAGRQMIMQLTG